jgi:peroxiredoxin
MTDDDTPRGPRQGWPRPRESRRRSSQLSVGDAFPTRRLRSMTTLSGSAAAMPDPGQFVHVQMRRFAGCPICNLHLRSVTSRIGEITAAGINEVVVFHSAVEELRRYESELPFTVVADPRKDLYRALGVESSARAIFNPRFWPRFPAVLAQVARTLRRTHHGAPLAPTGGHLGLPADFLVDSRGRVVAVKYGAHASDQWSVDELLEHAATAQGHDPAGLR